MGIFDFLFNRDVHEKKSHLRNLILVALVDGEIASREYSLLKRLSEHFGIKDSEFQELIENPHIGEFVVPKNYEDKMLQILDLITIMVADDKIESSEKDLCRSIALKLNINPKVIDDIILNIENDLKEGVSKEEIIKNLYQQK
ncbi:tellurite resistance TerB family protein [Marinigracilibium pacificum]|uniref:Tellurite resistance protein TerB n=1 Tax=Marinigracilibium pacificum TaxID=2729599 RepID=A0A848J172_9BACT|nr:hypothetical protein [Marinigracilibium pacificum]NMM49265.1 hypothetical protein [Marinigracilibium pacificum]